MKTALLILSMLLASAQSVASIVVFTNSLNPVSNVGANDRIVLLDRPEQLLQEFFAELPANPAQAEHIAQSILHSPDWQHHKEQQLLDAYQGVTEAYQLRLEKYPAVVFDGKYVVYGTADVALAQRKYEQFMGAE